MCISEHHKSDGGSTSQLSTSSGFCNSSIVELKEATSHERKIFMYVIYTCNRIFNLCVLYIYE